MHKKLAMFAVALLVAGYATAQEIKIAIDRDIPYEGVSVGRVQSLVVSVGRLTVSALLLPKLLGVLDAKLSSMGDLERDHWSRRIYWRGSTRFLSEIGKETDRLMLSTRVTYDQWTKIDLLFDELKTRVFEITKTVEWVFWIPESDLSGVTLRGKVTNIKDFPNWLEDLFDLRVEEALQLSLPVQCGSCNCQELTQQAGLKLSSVNFLRMENGSVNVKIAFDFTGELDVSECWSL